MLSLRHLSRLVRIGFHIAAAGLAATSAISARAANVPPELSTPLPPLTLARGATSAPIALAGHFRDPDVPGSAVRITTRIGSTTRVMDLALYDEQKAKTVANFLAYVDAGRYAANFFHRSVPGFIIQTGGFYFINDTTFDAVPTFEPVVNQPGLSNIRGTIAMAKLGGDPDSATSGWFINLADNSANLDAQNGGFTVFGRVLGDGMQVADAIAALPFYDTTVAPFFLPWDELPLSAPTLARQYFIETSAARVAPLSFTVASDNPALVSATVGSDGTLSLVASAELAGDTILRVTATDLEGGVFVASFPVRVTVPVLTLSDLVQTYDGQPRVPTATTSPAGLSVSFLFGDPGTATPPVAAGVYPVSASVIDPATSTTVTVGSTFTIARAPQTITLGALPDSLPVNAPAFALAATADSGLPVAFTVEGPATLGEDGVTLSLSGETGLVQIHADQAGDANREPAPRVTHTIAISKLPQSLDFPAFAARIYDPTANTLTLAAVSDAGLPVSYAVVSGPAHLAEDDVTLIITGAGEIVVTASQAGTATIAAAESVARTLVVAKAAQTLAFTTLPPALIDKLTLRDTSPEVRLPIAATSSSGLPVTLILNADVTPAYTGGLLDSATVALLQTSAPAVSSLSSTSSITIDDVSVIGAVPTLILDQGELVFYRRVEGALTLTATQDGDDNHLAAEPVTFTVDVGRAQTISFATPAARVFKASAPASSRTFALSATSTSRLPVVFEVVSGPATLAADQRTLTLHDTGTVVLRALQPGNAAYLPATPVVRTLLVNGAKQNLAFTAPASTATFTYGDAPIDLAATTTAPGGSDAFPITFSVLKGPATLAEDGRTLSLTGAGSVVVAANQVGGEGVSPASITRTLVVRKKNLLVSGVADWRPVGLANPPLALSYEGFVLGDTEADLAATRPKPQTSATKSSPAGDYPITFKGGLDANYAFTPEPVKKLTLIGFGGTYDALVGDASAPLGKLTLTLPANSLSYTGTLTLASEAKTIAIKSPAPLAFPDRYDEATGSWTRPAAEGVAPLTLVFSLSTEDGAWAGAKGGRIQGPGFDHPFELAVRGRPASVPHAGQHTLLLPPPDEGAVPGSPASLRGHGHATVRVAPGTAVLTLAGALADGSKLTATIQPNTGGTTYLLWTNPYGTRLHSYFAGHLNIEHFSTLAWKKAGSEKDKAVHAGFGPLPVEAVITPWLPPLAAKPAKGATPATDAITLADRLGLDSDGVTGASAFGLDYLPPAGAAITDTQIDGLPAALALTVAGKPVLPSPNPAKFALTFNAGTGAFSGSFVLTDTVPAPTKTNPAATKPHTRKVPFSGVLRHATEGETGYPVGQGFFLLDPLPGAASPEQVSGEIRLLAPREE